MWTVTSAHYVRIKEPNPGLSDGLYQVELPHPGAALVEAPPDSGFATVCGARTRVTMAEAEALSSTGIPSRQTSTFRSRLLVASAGRPPALGYVRFVTHDFFGLFARTFGVGAPWSPGEEAQGQPVAVPGRQARERLFRAARPRRR